ncbi:N2,N2-dimethylguanosine tRNA methyltransferase [Helicosporidium sp. ATCC 50920]|nr:N2,N2-dimethylguanosine tRNA methyltransferase [Helicosporidium sp. ATCC 50920]|eukprot:KDD75194.1 N2,N2-dimethylguanosine tRNA methyltransferase [Helicosporidium sp. ATCC 50920]
MNRDLSIAVLRYFAKIREADGASYPVPQSCRGRAKSKPAPAQGIRILEGLAASGLRAIRYSKEIPGVASITANDMDPAVVESMRRNIAFNGPEAESKIECTNSDACLLMMQRAGEFDAVDLDPYGSPSILLPSAVQAVAEGGLLLVTATDMAVLCGNNSETCFGKYGSYPLHKSWCHEQAVRIVLHAIQRAAAAHKRVIEPLISLSIDFYVRIFVRVWTSPARVKYVGTRTGYVWQSLGCDSFFWQRAGRVIERGPSVKYSPGGGPPVPQACPETGAGFSMGGPFWADPIHDPAALAGVLEVLRENKDAFPAGARVQALLTAASEELMDVPLYINMHDVCKTLSCTPPRAQDLRSALLNAGYRVSGTHACALGIKTDAPFSAFWDIMRCWVQEHPVKIKDPQSYAAKLLAKEPELKADFSRAQGAISKAKASKIARFMPNPTPNWGPKAKHQRHVPRKKESEENGEQADNGIETIVVEDGNKLE